MNFLCALITPDNYLRLLRALPLLSTLEIFFELLGEERIRQEAKNIAALQERLRTWGIAKRVGAWFLAYLKWAWYVFKELVDAGFHAASFWNPNVKGPFRESREMM